MFNFRYIYLVFLSIPVAYAMEPAQAQETMPFDLFNQQTIHQTYLKFLPLDLIRELNKSLVVMSFYENMKDMITEQLNNKKDEYKVIQEKIKLLPIEDTENRISLEQDANTLLKKLYEEIDPFLKSHKDEYKNMKQLVGKQQTLMFIINTLYRLRNTLLETNSERLVIVQCLTEWDSKKLTKKFKWWVHYIPEMEEQNYLNRILLGPIKINHYFTCLTFLCMGTNINLPVSIDGIITTTHNYVINSCSDKIKELFTSYNKPLFIITRLMWAVKDALALDPNRKDYQSNYINSVIWLLLGANIHEPIIFDGKTTTPYEYVQQSGDPKIKKLFERFNKRKK